MNYTEIATQITEEYIFDPELAGPPDEWEDYALEHIHWYRPEDHAAVEYIESQEWTELLAPGWFPICSAFWPGFCDTVWANLITGEWATEEGDFSNPWFKTEFRQEFKCSICGGYMPSGGQISPVRAHTWCIHPEHFDHKPIHDPKEAQN